MENINIAVSVHNNESDILHFVKMVDSVMHDFFTDMSYRFTFFDEGSTDRTLSELENSWRPYVHYIHEPFNTGVKHVALYALFMNKSPIFLFFDMIDNFNYYAIVKLIEEVLLDNSKFHYCSTLIGFSHYDYNLLPPIDQQSYIFDDLIAYIDGFVK